MDELNARIRDRLKRGILYAASRCARIERVVTPRQVRIYYDFPDFARKARALADVLRRKGIPVVVVSGQSFVQRARILHSPNLWIGYWNQYQLEWLPRNYVFYNAEPLWVVDPHRPGGWLRAMNGALEVWDYSKRNEEHARRAGVGFRFVPFGYAPYYEESFEAHTRGQSIATDIDVLFVGGLTDRRRAVLDRMRSMGMAVRVIDRTAPAYGRMLDVFIARSKIVVGIHRLDDPKSYVPDYARVDHLLSNRRFVVHERPLYDDPDGGFAAHVRTCSYEAIPAVCMEYLKHDREREAAASAAYLWFKNERPLTAFIPLSEIRNWLSGREYRAGSA